MFIRSKATDTSRRGIQIPQYGILRFAKCKGAPARALEAHHERQKEKYASNTDIDTTRSKHNFHIIKPAGHYRAEIDRRIEAAGCRTRKDSTRFVDTLITASPAFFKGKKPEEVAAYFKRAADFLCRRIGKQNVVSAVVHMDEKTPHMHLVFVPLTQDNRLSAKDILGNRASLSKWQDDFFAHMSAAYPELERGKSARETGRKHIPTQVFKQAVSLTKQSRKIKSALEDINPVNAGKKRDEVIAMLDKWFPQMEKFAPVMKKYQTTIQLLDKENQALADKEAANRESKIKHDLEIGKLQSQLQELEGFINSIPPEIMGELQADRNRQPGKER